MNQTCSLELLYPRTDRQKYNPMLNTVNTVKKHQIILPGFGVNAVWQLMSGVIQYVHAKAIT